MNRKSRKTLIGGVALTIALLAAIGAVVSLNGCCSIYRSVSTEPVSIAYVGNVGFGAPNRDGKIRFTAITCLATKTPPSDTIRLKNLPAGSYKAVYLNPDGTKHPVGSIVIN